jgi:transposase
LSDLLDKILKEFGISICSCTLRNILKSLGYSWRRIRKSLKSKRDEQAFTKFQKRLNRWQKQADQGKLDLYYFDEAGFNLTPSVCYAWQKRGTQIQVLSQRGSNYTVLGFMNKQLDFHTYIKLGSANSDDVIYCVDQFCEDIRKDKPIDHKAILILDNAPTHTSRKFKNRIRHWNSLGLRIEFLPKYSPELNLIEILWRFIKYKWLPFQAYSSKQSLVNELSFILKNIGSKYRINFS